MKHLLLMAFAILTIGCGEKKSDGDGSTHTKNIKIVDGTFYLKNSDKPYTGKIIDSFKNGGKKIEFNIKNGKPHGLSTQWYENGKMQAKTNNRDGKHDGLTERWYENGQKEQEGTYKEGKENGLVVLWYENGQKAEETTYKGGEANGPYMSWHENGQKESEGKWKNGQQEGLVAEWYENGQKKSEGNWENGKAEGLVTFWYKNGQKEEVQNWKNGKSEGLVTEWYEDGQKKSEGNWENGKAEGLVTFWYEDGQKKSEGNWENGKAEGLVTFWYKNGQKEEVQNWKNGKSEGLVTSWHENGQKAMEATYKDGEVVEGSEKFWNKKGEEVDSLEEAETSGGAERLLTLSVDGVEVTAKRIIEDFPKFEYFYITSSGAFSLDELRIGKTYESVTGDPSANDPDIIFSDSFDYLEGEKLVDQKGWYSISKPADCYTVREGSLISNKIKSFGNRLSSDATDTNSGLGIAIPDEVSFENEDTIYLSFLMRPEGTIGVGRWGGYFLVGAKPLDGKGILFGKPGSTAVPDDEQYGIDRQGGPHIVTSGVQTEVDKTSFVVVKMESNASGKKISELKPHAVQFSNLEERKGIRYLKNSDTPYTGKFFHIHSNGQKRATGDFKDGKPEGLMTYWYKNGQREMEGTFKGGKRNGQVIWWHENGQKKGEANFKDSEAISERYWNSKGEEVDSMEKAKQ